MRTVHVPADIQTQQLLITSLQHCYRTSLFGASLEFGGTVCQTTLCYVLSQQTNLRKRFNVGDLTLTMGPEMVPETSVIFNQLTGLIAQEDFSNSLDI
jgi:hypothetical protein